MSETSQTVVRRRKAIYVATFVTLFAGYFPLARSPWLITDQSHSLMEWVATILSLCIGALALVRFYSKKDNTFLFIGSGFAFTGLLDGYHAIVTLPGSAENIFSIPSSHPAWSGLASRVLLSVLLWLSWIFWKRERRLGAAGRISERLVFWSVGIIYLGLFLIFDLAPLGGVYHEGFLFPRPQELLPASFFLLALIGYLGKGEWKTDPFEHWLVLSLIVGFMGQAMYLALSHHINDTMFGAAHALKIISYLCAFVGLLLNMQRLFSESLAHQELALKNAILTTQQETSQDAILVVDENATIITYNQRFVELWGLPEDMVRRRDDKPVLAFVVGKVANPEEFLSRVKYLYEHKSEKSFEEIPFKDGRIIDRYSAPMIGADGRYYGRIWYLRDVTAKKRNEQMILESEEKFRGLVEQSLAGIALIEGDQFSYVNRKFADIFSYSVAEIKLLRTADVVVDKDVPIFAEVARRHLNDGSGGHEFTFQGLRKDGVVVDIEGRGTRISYGGKDALMVIILDITERIRAERAVQKLQVQLRELAIRDPLTDLYNRRYLDETISRELIRAERDRSPLSVVMGDIDHFKDINDRYGHLAGDEVLKTLGKLIKRHARGSDIACRYGGEEILLVFPGMDTATALARAEQLRLEFENTPVRYGNSAIRTTASFGVASFPEDGRDTDQLIAAADKALYAAKNAGRNKVRVSSA